MFISVSMCYVYLFILYFEYDFNNKYNKIYKQFNTKHTNDDNNNNSSSSSSSSSSSYRCSLF